MIGQTGWWRAGSVALAVWVGLAATGAAQRPSGATSTGTQDRFSTARLITPKTRRAVEGGLDWLSRNANRDGSFGPPNARIAITAIAALSFMANGSTANRGPYRRDVRRAIRFLANHVSTDPSHRGYIYLESDQESRMHGHGYATLALAEALGTYGPSDPERANELKRALVRAIRLIERTQSEAGGWYYNPENDGNHEGSITVCMLQALRAANNAGIYVKKRVVDNAINYIKRSAERRDGALTGAYKYSLTESQTSFALTSAAVGTLYMCGVYDSEYVRLGLLHMNRTLDDHLGSGQFYYYGLLYASQCYFQFGDDTWRRAYPRIRDSILRNIVSKVESPENAGSFRARSAESAYGDVYATAMATLTLQIPYRFLPIFQK